MIAFCVYGYSLLALAFSRRGDEGILPFFIISAMVLALYMAALAGVLYPVAMAMKYGAIPAFLLGAYLAWPGSMGGWAKALLPFPFIFLLAGCLFAGLEIRGLGLTHWDEFTHWGLYAKYLYIHNRMPGGFDAFYAGMDLPIMEKYPPGITLFHYFGVVGGPYLEDRLYQAGHVLIFAALAPLLSVRAQNHPATRVIIFLFTYLAVISLGHRFKTLMADQFMGLFFAGVLFVYFHFARGRLAVLAALGLPLGCLVIFKAAGALFCAVAIGVIFFCEAVEYFFPTEPEKRRGLALLAAGLIVVLIPLGAGISWRYYLLNMGYIKRHGFESPLTALAPKAGDIAQKPAGGDGGGAKGKIKSEFIGSALSYKVGGGASAKDGGLPVAGWLAIAAVLFGAAWYCAPPRSFKRRAASITVPLIMAGGALYFGSILTVYLNVLKVAGLPSFERYINIYLLGVMLVALGMFLGSQIREIAAAGTLLFGSALIIWAGQTLDPLSPFDLHTEHRTGHGDKVAFARAVIPEGKRVLISCDEGCGVHSYIIRYELLPSMVDVTAWNPAGASTSKEKRDYIGYFDYVYLLNAKAQMRAELEAMADPVPGAIRPFLYRVVKKDGKPIKLVAVTDIPRDKGEYVWGDTLALRLATSFGVDGIYHDVPGKLRPVKLDGSPPAVSLGDPILYRPCLEAAAGVNPAYLISDPTLAESIRGAARRAGASFSESREGGYPLFHSFLPPKGGSAIKSIPPEEVAITASSNSAAAQAAMDGNAATFWSSNAPQTGITIEFGLPGPRAIAGVDLLSTYPENSPLTLAIEYSMDGKRWTAMKTVDRAGAAMRFYGRRFSVIPRSRLLSYRFAPVQASRIRLRQTGESVVDWHIAETWIYEQDGAVPPKAPAIEPPAEWKALGTLADPFTLARIGRKDSFPEPEPALVSTVCSSQRDPAADMPGSRPVEELGSIIATPEAMPAAEAYVEREGIIAQTSAENGYKMWIKPVHPMALRGPIEKGLVASLRASHNQAAASLTYGVLSAPWRSGVSQAPGISLLIGLARPVMVSGVALDAGTDMLDLPRTAKVEVSMDGRTFLPAGGARNVHRRFKAEEGWPVGEDSALAFAFEPVRAAFVRVTLVEGREMFNWTVSDVTVYQPKSK
jgi:hypothetical protein